MTWWYKNPNNPKNEQEMAAAYEKKYSRPAADKTWMGWLAMKSLLDSIEAAKSTESAKIVDALEHWSVTRDGLPSAYRPFDHQMTNRLLVCQVKPKITDKWDYFDVKAELPKDQAGVDAAFGSKADSACKMDSL